MSDPRRMPRQLGAFLIDKELWHGSHSTVYLARDSRDSAAVALKVLYASPEFPLEQQKRTARREASRLKVLSHENIVPLRKHGEIDGLPYLSFPFIEGQGLDVICKANTVALEPLLRALVKVCHALHHAHRQGILHRDLKPRNILIDQRVQPYVLDWGLAWKMGDKSEGSVQSIVGTPAYMSPEQARGEEQSLTPATDVYSLGAILYHVLTGKPPFEAGTSWKTMQMAMSLPPRPPSQLKTTVDLKMERVVLWALEKDPERRYASAESMAEDMQRALDNEKPRGPAGVLGRLFGRK
ncbi:MAG TPA: serine/threonine-protein kinase [Planctomycetota bacterium]|nr:serine/threonine-protein kinase [Planctomycetota bacterium]